MSRVLSTEQAKFAIGQVQSIMEGGFTVVRGLTFEGSNPMTEIESLPALYEHMVECGIIDLDPWALLRGEMQQRRAQHIEQVFPGWGVTPFARRTDNDDVACWTGSKVVVIDDWDLIWDENGARRIVAREYASMEEWFLAAARDFIEFDWS